MPRCQMKSNDFDYDGYIADSINPTNSFMVYQTWGLRDNISFRNDEEILALYIFLTNNFSHLFKDKDGKPL